MTDCAPISHGLVFSISPAKKQPKKKNEEEEEENILTLAPFTKPPKINFGQLKINESVQRSVLLINPQQFDLDLVVTNNELNINNIQLTIEKGKNVNLKITWSPEKPGNFKFAILFEVTNSARLKFLVHAFGICIKPEEKKPIRKPLNMLQPLKREKKPEPQQPPLLKKETTISTSTKYKTTTTTTTTIFKKTGQSSKNVFDETVIIDKKDSGDKENNKKHLGLTIEAVTDTKKKSDVEFKNPKSLYDDSFSEDSKPSDATPKLPDIPFQPACQNIQLTPKLSDFLKPSFTLESEQIMSGFLATTTTMTKVTKIASTKLIDIEIDQENPVNNKTIVSQGPKTPHFPFKSYNSYFGDSIPYPNENNLVECMKTPKLDRDFLYRDDSFQFDDSNLEKYVIMCQRAWRYKMFRKKLRELKHKNKTEKLNQLLAGSKGLAMEFELLNKKQDEFFVQQQLEKQRKEMLLAEMEKEEQERKEKLLKCVLMFQKAVRMKRFRKFLTLLRQKAVLKSVLVVQRKWRFIKFRRCLTQLKMEEHQRIEKEFQLNKYATVCQRVFRYKKFRQSLARLRSEKARIEEQNSAASLIQKSWRMMKFRHEMTRYRQAALIIQKWYRNSIKPRNDFLKLKKYCSKIQAVFRHKMVQKNTSALVIQSTWKGYVERKRFLKIKTSIIKIQQWFRSKEDRIRFLKLKRSLPCVQSKCRQLVLKQNKSACVIQKTFRMFKFRQSMNRYRSAAVLIQTWTRSMKFRYEYLQRRRVVVKSVIIIQKYVRMHLARKELCRLSNEKLRHQSACIIQKVWKGYKIRKEFETIRQKRIEEIQIEHEIVRLNQCAAKIQAVWRGFRVRKTTTNVLRSIRTRLSFYQVNTSGESNSTLGSRIQNSLKILKYPCVPIQQIILALTDLDKVTRLSPECCLIFTREGAIEILYTFIMNCNRSVPHMDLVKLCLQILINLSKYSQTVDHILRPPGSCLLLLNLLQAYQSSNPQIFMDACIIFILLAEHESIKSYILRQDSLIKKVTGIHSVLERRANFSKERQISKGCLNSKEQLNSTLNIGLSCINKKSLIVSFSFQPDWSLAKKSTIELVDSLGALEYMMDSMNIVPDVATPNPISARTPKKSLSSSAIDKSGKKSSTKTSKPQTKPSGSKLSTKQLFKEPSKTERIQEELGNKNVYTMEEHSPVYCETEFDDDHYSITSNESYRSISSVTTVKSITNLNQELPKLNSTLVGSSKGKFGGLKKSESVNFS